MARRTEICDTDQSQLNSGEACGYSHERFAISAGQLAESSHGSRMESSKKFWMASIQRSQRCSSPYQMISDAAGPHATNISFQGDILDQNTAMQTDRSVCVPPIDGERGRRTRGFAQMWNHPTCTFVFRPHLIATRSTPTEYGVQSILPPANILWYNIVVVCRNTAGG